MAKVTLENLEVGLDRNFMRSVAGESHYQEALRAIDGGRRSSGQEVIFDACLLPEASNPYDANAILIVDAQQRQVGYLPRNDAAEFKPYVDALLRVGRFLSCPARLTGGEPGKPFLGVTLSLPDPEVIVADHAEFFPVAPPGRLP